METQHTYNTIGIHGGKCLRGWERFGVSLLTKASAEQCNGYARSEGTREVVRSIDPTGSDRLN